MKDSLRKSVDKLRADGWHCTVAGRRGIDGKTVGAFGFASLLCIKGPDVMLVQVTNADYLQEALRRVQNNPSARIWLSSHHRQIAVHGWTCLSPHRWKVSESFLTPADFQKTKMD